MTTMETDPNSNPIKRLWHRLTHSAIWPVIVLIYIAFVTYEVSQAPRSLFWRLLFLAGLLFIYYMPHPTWVKILYGGVVAVVLVPLVGVSNPFLLELGFQICVFATLALGLNVVVGFSGLLDLGYIA